MAIESLAVFNAVSAIEGTPGYLVSLTAPEGASAVAATAQAAHDALVQLFPSQKAMFDAQLALSLAAIPDGQSESDGIAAGAQAAAAMIALRADDGWNASVAYTPGTDPGMWQPTPPANLPAAAPQWADLEPFALDSPDQFLPDGPPDLTSRAYARSLLEVRALGAVDSTLRTPEQTEIAEFWVFGARTPPGAWNDIASDIAQAEGLSLTETARLLATLNVAEADSLIAVWDAKYFYDTWRPVTAIPNANDIGNRWVERWGLEDPDWLPLLVTPNHPEYVSAHSAISAAAAEVLTEFFGRGYDFSFTAPTGATRTFTGFWDAALEAGWSRIYGGIHFSFSNQDGRALGEDVAEWVLDSFAENSSADAVALSGIAFGADASWG
jgi:membrane-associated phospholipid phosphatase